MFCLTGPMTYPAYLWLKRVKDLFDALSPNQQFHTQNRASSKRLKEVPVLMCLAAHHHLDHGL